VLLIEVFLIAMIYNYGFFTCLPSGHLATHLILALIINRRYYLDARTAFILLYIGIKTEILIKFYNIYIVYTDNILPRSASVATISIKLSQAGQYVA
jgi:hypothetical protein